MIRDIDIARFVLSAATVIVWCFCMHFQSKTRTPEVMDRFRRDKGLLIAMLTGLPPKKYMGGEERRYYDLCTISGCLFVVLAVFCVIAQKL